MRHVLMALCLPVGLAHATPAPAHQILLSSGEGLLENCSYRSSDVAEVEHHAGLCLGYIKGVSNAYHEAGTLDLCVPATMDNEDLVESVVSRMKLLEPKLLKISSALIVRYALADSFPCQGARPGSK